MRLEDFEFRERGPAIGEADIAALEKELKAKLPQDYRAFLLKFNGGKSKLCLCRKLFFGIRYWFCITESNKRPAMSIVTATQNMREELLDKYFPIGEAEDGSAVIMQVATSGPGRVGLLLPDNNIDEDLYLGFSSFGEFLDELEHVEEDEYTKFILAGPQE